MHRFKVTFISILLPYTYISAFAVFDITLSQHFHKSLKAARMRGALCWTRRV